MTANTDIPNFFRLDIQVGNLDVALETQGKLLGLVGRKAPGSRCYFTCGPVPLQVVEVESIHPACRALYFTVKDLDAVFARASELGWLTDEVIHGEPGGRLQCGRGANVRSTWRTSGRTRCASSKRARCIRVRMRRS